MCIRDRAIPELDKQSKRHFFSRAKQHQGQGDVPAAAADQDTPECPECQRFFKSERALRMHRVRVHGHTSGVATRINVEWCPNC
eukprot:2774028-Alexandrium_andersonii.AAC.1